MDLPERVARRQTDHGDGDLLVDRSALSPAAHVAEPVGRAPVLERLLDAVDPVFVGQLPPEVSVAGPAGTGKSALVTALFAALDERLGRTGTLATSTRGGQPRRWFATVDCRRADSPFRFYRAILSQFDGEDVPEHGVGTEALRDRLVEQLSPSGRWAVVAVDHLAETSDLDVETVRSLVSPVDDSVALAWVDREPRATEHVVELEPYRHHALSDVLSQRCSRGLSTDAVSHDVLREIAAREEGNAHDALAVTLGAALLADHRDASAIDRDDALAAASAVPEGTAHLDAVLALPANRQSVLAALLAMEPDPTVGEAAESVADRTGLSAGTVRRFCYELAEAGILSRRPADGASDAPGRDPGVLRPAFPWLAFAGLADGVAVADVCHRLE